MSTTHSLARPRNPLDLTECVLLAVFSANLLVRPVSARHQQRHRRDRRRCDRFRYQLPPKPHPMVDTELVSAQARVQGVLAHTPVRPATHPFALRRSDLCTHTHSGQRATAHRADKPKSDKRRPQQQRTSAGPPILTPNGLCRDFQLNRCERPQCRFKHSCAKCLQDGHGRAACKTSATAGASK